MLSNLLILNEKIPVPDALLYALIGFVFVFVGIGILIGILYLVGFIMQKTNGVIPNPFKRKKQKTEEQPVLAAPVSDKTKGTEEIPEEVKAAIVAAIMSYYSVEKPKCEFVIKKIKRI